MPTNKNNASNEWKNGWKNSWKDPAYQNISDDIYTYQRKEEKSKWQQWKDVQQKQKSDYVGIRKQARKEVVGLVISVIGALAALSIAIWIVFIK